MAYIEAPAVQEGDSVINMDPSTKLWPDYKAEGDEYALITMHTMPFEGSVGLINQLTATRLNRKGFHTAILLYGPAVLMASNTRGFLKEGCKIYACRFAMAALYGMRESDLIPGVQAIHPLDVLDIQIEAFRRHALIMSTWTV